MKNLQSERSAMDSAAGPSVQGGGTSRRAVGPVSALAAAIFCTGLIGFAIYTAFGSQANGDLMLIVIPVLGAIFFSIPAGRAWVAFVRSLKGR